jgi:hypothetical protein
MKNLIFIFSITILFFSCNSKEKESAFFLNYLKKSRLIENDHYKGKNMSDHVQHKEIEYFEDSILIKKFKHGFVPCELYKTDSLFSDDIYYIGIIKTFILPNSGYIILFDENGKYLDQKEISGKYYLDFKFKNLNGYPKKFLIVGYGNDGEDNYNKNEHIYTVSNNKITLLHEYRHEYTDMYGAANMVEDSLVSFSYQANQVMMIHQISRGENLHDPLQQYLDTTIIEPSALLINN